MALTKALFGFEPARKQGGNYNSGAFNQYPIKNAYAGNIFYGDPVILVSGFGIQQSSVTTDKVLGIFYGCVFNNPNFYSQPTFLRYWPSGTSVTDGSQPVAYVADDPYATYFIQADASVSIGDIGWNFDVTLGAGNTTTQRSTYGLQAGTRKATSGLMQIVGLKGDPNNAWSDPNPVVEVRLVQNRNAYTSAF